MGRLSNCLCAYAQERIQSGMKNAVDILAALAEPTRLAAVRLLWDGKEHCVCELMERLGATQSRMSRHMGALKLAGLVIDRRDAQWVRYRRRPDLPAEVTRLVDAALALTVQPDRIAA
jgi:ArsR family transcriptional regulator